IDRYAETLVLKLYTAAWLPHLRDVIPGLQRVQPFDRLVLRVSRRLAPLIEPYGLTDGQTLIGSAPSGSVHFEENGLRFAADVAAGQRLGFCFDDRDTRAQGRSPSSGGSVVAVFSYSGVFWVEAAGGGGVTLLRVEASAPVLEGAFSNFALKRDRPPIRAAR